jgi:hypothetical protein
LAAAVSASDVTGGEASEPRLCVDVLGPLQISLPDQGALNVQLPSRAESLLRVIVHAGSGARATSDYASRLRLSGSALYDGAHRLRASLEPLGFTVPRVGADGYRIIDLDGTRVEIDSDLYEFRTRCRAFFAERAEMPASLGREELPRLQVLTRQIATTRALWRHPEAKSRWLHNLGADTAELDVELTKLHIEMLLTLSGYYLSASYVQDAAREVEAVAGNDKFNYQAWRKRLNTIQRQQADAVVADEPDDEEFDVFVAVPMAAIDAGDYQPNRQLALQVCDALRQNCAVRNIFCAASDITSPDEFEEPSVGLARNSGPFHSARYFVMILPEKSASSVLVEAGMAIAHGMSSTYFVRKRDDLPWILQDVGSSGSAAYPPVRIVEYRSDEELIKKIKNNGPQLFKSAARNGIRPKTVDLRGERVS